jgi:hypothetical protein
LLEQGVRPAADFLELRLQIAVIANAAHQLVAEEPRPIVELQEVQLPRDVVGEVGVFDRHRLEVLPLFELLSGTAHAESVEEDLLPIGLVVLLGLLLVRLDGLVDFRLLHLEKRVRLEFGLQVLLEVEQRHIQQIHRLVQARVHAQLLAELCRLL